MPTIWRPFKRDHATGRAGHLIGFAAGLVHCPDLRRPVARRNKSDAAAVGRPARSIILVRGKTRTVVLVCGGEWYRLAPSVGRHDPNGFGEAVLLPVGFLRRKNHLTPVR